MKKYLMLFVFVMSVSAENGHALAVIDSSNLAQNLVSAREAITQTQ